MMKNIRLIHLLPLLAVLLLANSGNLRAQAAAALPENDQCIICHQEDENMPEDFNLADIHLQNGLSCAGCHGGDPTSDDDEVSMSPEKGFVGVPEKKDIPQFCGKCHSDITVMRQYQPRIATDQVAQYYTSVHGQRLQAGDEKVADCTSCHTAHSIFSAKDPRSSVYALNVPGTCNHCHGDADYMADYPIRHNQYEEYAASVHGQALLENHDTGAPACNDCHGNHGATPPGIASVSHVCGTCHVNNMQYYATTVMAREFEAEGIHGCEECHGYHSVEKTFDEMVGVGEKSVCMDCHEEGEEAYVQADSIYIHLSDLKAAYDSAATQQEVVRRIGMDDVEIGFLLQESHQSLIQARTLVHKFEAAAVGEKTSEGLGKAQEALKLAYAQIEDANVRRMGFGVATLFITLLCVALFLKIRDMEKQ